MTIGDDDVPLLKCLDVIRDYLHTLLLIPVGVVVFLVWKQLPLKPLHLMYFVSLSLSFIEILFIWVWIL